MSKILTKWLLMWCFVIVNKIHSSSCRVVRTFNPETFMAEAHDVQEAIHGIWYEQGEKAEAGPTWSAHYGWGSPNPYFVPLYEAVLRPYWINYEQGLFSSIMFLNTENPTTVLVTSSESSIFSFTETIRTSFPPSSAKIPISVKTTTVSSSSTTVPTEFISTTASTITPISSRSILTVSATPTEMPISFSTNSTLVPSNSTIATSVPTISASNSSFFAAGNSTIRTVVSTTSFESYMSVRLNSTISEGTASFVSINSTLILTNSTTPITAPESSLTTSASNLTESPTETMLETTSSTTIPTESITDTIRSTDSSSTSVPTKSMTGTMLPLTSSLSIPTESRTSIMLTASSTSTLTNPSSSPRRNRH